MDERARSWGVHEMSDLSRTLLAEWSVLGSPPTAYPAIKAPRNRMICAEETARGVSVVVDDREQATIVPIPRATAYYGLDIDVVWRCAANRF